MAGPNVVKLPSAQSLSWEDCRLLVESVVDYAIFMLDDDGYVTTWNPGANRLKGYATEEIVGKHFSVFYTEEDRASHKPERILERARLEAHCEDEGWRVRKDGTLFWANVVVTALRAEDGRLRGYAKVTRDMTDRRKAEEDLRRSEERFRLLVESVSDYAIYMLDPTGRVETWNLGAERMKGYAAGEVIGRNFEMFFPREAVAGGKPARELVTASAQGRFEDEGWRVRKDGSRFWANAILTALYDARGQLTGYAKVTRDLTARREAEEKERQLLLEQAARDVAEKAEQQLREGEARYRALSDRLQIVLEGVADGITVQDRSGRVVFANTAAARICGFQTGDELVNTPPADVVARFEMLDAHGGPFDVQNLPARRVLAGEGPASAVLHVRERATGRDWWVLLRASAVLDAQGEPELAINIWHDVTAERREETRTQVLADATAALGSSLAHAEMLTSLANVLVPGLGDWCSIYLLEGDDLREVTVAHADRTKLELAREYQRRYPHHPRHAGGAWHVIETGVSEVFNEITDEMLTLSTTDPEALAMLRSIGIKAALLVPLRGRSKVLGVLALVSAEKRRLHDAGDVALAEELGRRAGVAIEHAQLYLAAQRAAKAAEEAAKVAEEASRAKDEFLATVSHELRTPLNAIVGWSSVLKARVRDASTLKPIEIIHRNAVAQVKIIEDILDVSRVITGNLRLEPRSTDLATIARDAIEVIRPSAQAKRIAVEFAESADRCLVVADPERLQQVVWNLLSNAVKFTEPRGTIRVSVRQEGSEVVIEVSDTGKGIEPEFLPLMFERFRQADSSTTRRFGGLGLGLALVRHIIELHGGKVSAKSEGLGKGATFTICLPIRAVSPTEIESALKSRAASSASGPTSSLIRPGMRVLVVDDEADARDLVATVLMEAGAQIETAASAAEGLAVFKRFHPHVLVTDIGMPEEDGFSFIRHIRALPAEEGGMTPSLALTAFARDQDRTKALSAGFTTHIGKPVDRDALVAAVGNLASIRYRD